MKCKAKKAFFAGKNDIYHRWKEVTMRWRPIWWQMVSCFSIMMRAM